MSERLQLEARTFVPSPGKSRIYLYRQLWAPNARCTFNVDEYEALVGPETFMMAEVEPGAHVVAFDCAGTKEEQTIELESGALYFGLIGIAVGSELAFDQVPEDEGRHAVETYEMAWTSQIWPEEVVPYTSPWSRCTTPGEALSCRQ